MAQVSLNLDLVLREWLFDLWSFEVAHQLEPSSLPSFVFRGQGYIFSMTLGAPLWMAQEIHRAEKPFSGVQKKKHTP
jgi:hypothetical protein